MSNKQNLPYFKKKATKQECYLGNFFLRKVNPFLKRNIAEHYLINRRDGLVVRYLKKHSAKYPYFLRLDVDKYFPSIDHHTVIHNLPVILKQVTGRQVSRRAKYYIKKDLPRFLSHSPLGTCGLPIGNYLGYVLAGIYLLPLDLKIYKHHPFLRFNDDYIILFKGKNEAEKFLQKTINPTLDELKLKIKPSKTYSGRFHHEDRVDFLGYSYYSGYFGISEEKKEKFKKRIDKLTYLTGQKPIGAIIKLVNNQIHGFGNYYKHCQIAKEFDELDCYIRMRVRRYAIRQKEVSPQLSNTFITNKELKDLGLKSLREKLEKYKNRLIRQKKLKVGKSGTTIGKAEKYKPKVQDITSSDQILLKLINDKLDTLTGLAKENKRRIKNLEAKLVKYKQRPDKR